MSVCVCIINTIFTKSHFNYSLKRWRENLLLRESFSPRALTIESTFLVTHSTLPRQYSSCEENKKAEKARTSRYMMTKSLTFIKTAYTHCIRRRLLFFCLKSKRENLILHSRDWMRKFAQLFHNFLCCRRSLKDFQKVL